MALPTPPSPFQGFLSTRLLARHARGGARRSGRARQVRKRTQGRAHTHTHTHRVMSEGAVCQQHILQHFSLLANQLLKEELPAPGQRSPPARLSCAAEEGSGLGTAAALRGALSAPSFIIH